MPHQEVVLQFPEKGLDVTREFGEQPPGTTADCVNVASRDSIAGRRRGGSRAGMSKYIAEISPQGAVRMQCLEVIVDPTTAALKQNFETPGDDWIPHPRFPAILIPPGGAPWQPTEDADQPSVALTLVQDNVLGFDNVAAEQTINFTTTPADGNTLIVVVVTLDNDANTTVAVTNGAANVYTQIGAYKRITHGLGPELSMSLWRKEAADGASEAAVKVTPSSQTELKVGIMDWRGANLATPIGNTANNSGSANPMTTGNIVVSGSGGEAVVGCFTAAFAPDTVTPGAGYTLVINSPDGSADNTDIQLYVVAKENVANGTENPQATFAGGADTFVALGIEIND
jgi:hypothetical protein